MNETFFTTTTHVTTPFAKEDLKRGFFPEIYCLHASVPLLMYFFLILSHLFFELETSNFGYLLIFLFCLTMQSFRKIEHHLY